MNINFTYRGLAIDTDSSVVEGLSIIGVNAIDEMIAGVETSLTDVEKAEHPVTDEEIRIISALKESYRLA